MKTQTRDHEATATPSKQCDEQTSGKETHLRLGGVAVSASYAHFWPGIYPYYPYGFPYGPFYSPISAAQWWDPFWGFFPVVYPAGYFSPGDGKGEVKLNDAPKNASVYLNGGYAGTVEHLKSFWLDPGVYDVVLSAPDGRQYQQRVYVLTGMEGRNSLFHQYGVWRSCEETAQARTAVHAPLTCSDLGSSKQGSRASYT